MEFKQILEYQKLDNEIVKLEKVLNESQDKKILNNLVEIVKETQNLSANLEKEAQVTYEQYTALQKTYDENLASFNNFNKKDMEKLSENEIAEVLKISNNILSNLNLLEKKLMAQAEKINNILSDFENTKKKYIAAKEKHKIHKEKLDEQKQEFEPKINEIRQKLNEMEKNIDKVILEKYKIKRQDRVFPIFVPTLNNACGGCMMELPSALIEKLKSNGYLICENCGRIIYYKEN